MVLGQWQLPYHILLGLRNTIGKSKATVAGIVRAIAIYSENVIDLCETGVRGVAGRNSRLEWIQGKLWERRGSAKTGEAFKKNMKDKVNYIIFKDNSIGAVRDYEQYYNTR